MSTAQLSSPTWFHATILLADELGPGTGACGYDGRVWEFLRIADSAGSRPMARTR